MIDPQLEGKTAIITGANHGIGAATARKLAAQGVRLLLHYYRVPPDYDEQELARAAAGNIKGSALYQARQQQPGEQTAAAIAADGGFAFAWEADLSQAENIGRLFDICEREVGACDILIANHTHCIPHTFDPELAQAEGVRLPDAAEIDRHFAVNARAVALMMHEYVQRHRARQATWGRIINISTSASRSHLGNVSYAASKYAIESYTHSAAVEIGKYGITVNAVAPGPTQTGYMPQQLEDSLAGQLALRRIGWPDDVADVVVFIASEQARWITGEVIYASGGWR